MNPWINVNIMLKKVLDGYNHARTYNIDNYFTNCEIILFSLYRSQFKQVKIEIDDPLFIDLIAAVETADAELVRDEILKLIKKIKLSQIDMIAKNVKDKHIYVYRTESMFVI